MVTSVLISEYNPDNSQAMELSSFTNQNLIYKIVNNIQGLLLVDMQKISFLPSAAVTHYSCRGFGRVDSFVAVQFQDVFASSHCHLQKEEQQYKLSRSVSPRSNKPDFYLLAALPFA